MLTRWQLLLTTLLSLVVAALAGYCMVLLNDNRGLQAELAGRSQYVRQTAQLEGLYREMVASLADLSVRNQDGAIVALLGGQGITVNAAPASTTDPRKGTKP